MCVTIVAAFPLDAAAGQAISEDIPIPAGTVALTGAAGIRGTPDRSRFVAEVARLIYETPERQRQDPESMFSRLQAHVDAAGRFRNALVRARPGGSVSLAAVGGGTDRDRLRELLELVGLRLRENRGKYSVEPTDDGGARERVRLLANLGIDVTDLGAALNRGETIVIRVPDDRVPIPLTAELWSREVFDTQVASADLFGAIMSDERAALLCNGLASLDTATLQHLVDNRSLIGVLYTHARIFAAFGSHLKIHNGRIVTPGAEHGPAAAALWEDLVGARVTEPSRFVAELFGRSGGRLAYLYDTIGELDRPRAAFALSLWIQDTRVRTDRVRALAAAVAAAFPEWPTSERVFIRPLHDLAALLMSVEVNADGSPREPAARHLWSRAFESEDLPDDPMRQLGEMDREGPIDAGWLAETVVAAEARVRGQRLMQVAFGHRVFGEAEAESWGDVLVALRALPTYRAVMLGLERTGIRRPAVYAAAARQSERLGRLEGDRAFVALSQFQGALALVARMSAVGSIDARKTEALVTALAAVPLNDDGRFQSGIAAWLRREVLGRDHDEDAKDAEDAEEVLIAALAGQHGPAGRPEIDWEGERYRVDLAVAETLRLRRIRERQGGYSASEAMQLATVALALTNPSIDLDGVKRATSSLDRLRSELAPKETRSASDLVPGGADDLPDPREVVERAISELEKITRPRDARQAADVADDLFQAADMVLGEVLSSLAYAVSLGDPDGPTLLGGDVARRHDFGIGSRVPGVRTSMPWSIPEQRYDPGVPWHVTGSLIGLDVALAPLALRRMSTDTLTPPALGSNDRETFARSVALMNPFSLRDADRDAIVSAVGLGRQRVTALKAGADVDAIGDEIRMDGWRRQALQWTIAREPERKLSYFSLTELFILGGGHIADVHAWGTAMTPVFGCLCTRMPAANVWRFVTGRPQVGVLGTAVPDVALHVALALGELGLPAALARSVLSAAMQQFVDTVKPIDGNDWLTLVRGAQSISRERIEDFVAAAAVVGGPLVRAGTPPPREQ